MTNIVATFKKFLEEGKYSDGDAQKMMDAFKSAGSQDADKPGTPDLKKPDEVDKDATKVPPTVEKIGTATPDKNKDAFTMEELMKAFDARIDAREKEKAKHNEAKEQVSFSPVIDNPRKDKKMYRVLKMKN